MNRDVISRWKRDKHPTARPLSNRAIALGAVVVLVIGAVAFTVLLWLLDLTEAHPHQLNLSDCQVRSAEFDGARIAGDTWFSGARFAGHAWFERAEFAGRAELIGHALARAVPSLFSRLDGALARRSLPRGRKQAGCPWCATRIRASSPRNPGDGPA